MDSRKDSETEVFRRYDDGYIIRGMTARDAAIVQGWFGSLVNVSRWDLDVCLKVFPSGHGFYIGELDGQVIASCVQLPWAEGIFYGSYYYVDEAHRGKGYGTRLRDEVTREYLGSSVLCVEAARGKVATTNRTKFGYTDGNFVTERWEGTARADVGAACPGVTVHKAVDVPFDEVMSYDDRNFVRPGGQMRRAFLEEWQVIPGGAAFVLKDAEGNLQGLGFRRPCIQKGQHQIGPLYADTSAMAEVLLQTLCEGIQGEGIVINTWNKVSEPPQWLVKFGLKKVFDVPRMYINGDPGDYKDTVHAVTSIDVCGF